MTLPGGLMHFVRAGNVKQENVPGAQAWDTGDGSGAQGQGAGGLSVEGIRLAGQKQGFGMSVPDKKKKDPSAPQQKTAFMLLNEKFPSINSSIQFDTHQTPDKKTFYRCYVELQGQLFCGEGVSKKTSKQAMAQRAVQSLIPERLREQMLVVSEAKPGQPIKNEAGLSPEKKPKVANSRPASIVSMLKDLGLKKGTEYFPKFEFSDASPPDAKIHEKMFKCTLKINDQTFTETGKGKQKLKNTVGKGALMKMYSIPEADIPRDAVAKKYKFDVDKNPLQTLHEALMQNGGKVAWDVMALETKPPTYKALAKVTMEGEEKAYEEQSHNKRFSRIKTACVIIRDMFEVEIDPEKFLDESNRKRKIEKSGIDLEMYTKPAAERQPPALLLHELCQKSESKEKPVFEEAKQEKIGKNVVMFTMNAKFRGVDYMGSGMSKKMAKTQVSREILKKAFELDTPDPTLANQTGFGPGFDGHPLKLPRYSVPPIADLVSTLAKRKYRELCGEHGVQPTSYMAAFVITTGSTMNDGSLISLGTGACIREGDAQTAANGLCIIDSHAEVLARRGLMLFFYQQLSMLANPLMAQMSVFEPRQDGHGYKLKDNVKLHFYSILPPSGDARLSKMGLGFRSEQEGALRTYIPGGGKTITTLEFRKNQNWKAPGQAITPSETQINVMSVSDKILKWNVVGVQGALLSKFIQPIFVDTFVIGSECDRDAVMRAVNGRVIPKLSTDEEIPQPTITGVSEPELVDRSMPPPSAVSWTAAAPGIELIAQNTGMEMTGKPSRLCKQFIFEEFAKLDAKLKHIDGQDVKWSTYNEAKLSATTYQTVKLELMKKCESEGLGPWMYNSHKIEGFGLPWAD